MTARIASRSSGARRGLQTSQIRMIAGLVAVVPGLVLDRVVEHPGLAHAPLARLAAHAEAAVPAGSTSGRCTTRRKFAMPVCGGMRVFGFSTENMAVGERRSTIGLRQAPDGGHRRRRPGAALVDRAALVVEMEGAPARRLVELAPLVERQVVVVMDVGAEARLVLDAGSGRARAWMAAVAASNSGSHGNSLALVELDVRQPRVAYSMGSCR